MIEVIQADITTLNVDAIVNAANQTLLGGGGVDGAIHRAAGPELLEFNRSLGGCTTGEAKISPGFKLQAKWIIHTVGPVWHGGSKSEAKLLRNCYRNALTLAHESSIESIAFSSISTGIYGFPKREAARIALTEMKQFENRISMIIACCYSAEDVTIYRTVMTEFDD